MPAEQYAHQVEKTDQRNVARHDDSHPPDRFCSLLLVRSQPCFEQLRLQHIVAYRPYGESDRFCGEPTIRFSGPADYGIESAFVELLLQDSA